MNYVLEIVSFNEWLTTNPSVTSNDVALWYALMNINNSCGWKQEFTAAISTIMDKSRLSRDSIYRSRNKLVQLGRIKVKERGGNQSALYTIIPIVSLTATQSHTQSSTQSATQTTTQSATIPKLNEIKENDYKAILEKDKSLFEKMAMAWNINQEAFQKMIHAFEASLASNSKTHKEYGAYKAHFHNWGAKNYDKYLSANPKKQMIL